MKIKLCVLYSLVFITAVVSMGSAANLKNEILLKNGSIDISKGWQDYSPEWLAPETSAGYYLVHYESVIEPEWKNMLTQSGTIMAYVPYNTYLVKFNESGARQAAGLEHVDWVGLYQPVFKVDETIFDYTLDTVSKIRITLFPGEPFENLERVVGQHQGIVLDTVDRDQRRRLVCEIPRQTVYDAVKTMAFLPEVEWIQRYPEYSMCNDNTQWVCQSGPYGGQSTPLYDHGILGEGQIVGVMDTGCDADMCFFYDSAEGMIVPNAPANYDQRKIVAYIGPSSYASGFDTQGHGTHTAGTIAGDNFASPGSHDNGDGIAMLAKLIIQDYGDSYDVYPPDDEYTAHQDVYDLGGRVHSNSWGWPSNYGSYIDDCQEVDQFIWDNPTYSIVYAAGNEGPDSDSIRPPGTSKNVLTAGATENGGAQPENNESFS
ncbi:S8 family serine peptidase, partial [bacterium]|nr:S8 family serine peptidase [candidate division CSSED10-310 bacterium]